MQYESPHQLRDNEIVTGLHDTMSRRRDIISAPSLQPYDTSLRKPYQPYNTLEYVFGRMKILHLSNQRSFI
jgi:hypothetical protein